MEFLEVLHKLVCNEVLFFLKGGYDFLRRDLGSLERNFGPLLWSLRAFSGCQNWQTETQS